MVVMVVMSRCIAHELGRDAAVGPGHTSWHEPTVAHFQKLINKYDKLRQQSDQK